MKMHAIGNDQATLCGQNASHCFSWLKQGHPGVTCKRCVKSQQKNDRENAKSRLKAGSNPGNNR